LLRNALISNGVQLAISISIQAGFVFQASDFESLRSGQTEQASIQPVATEASDLPITSMEDILPPLSAIREQSDDERIHRKDARKKQTKDRNR
jgi:hypothetical protein